jgi:hypothetical protein
MATEATELSVRPQAEGLASVPTESTSVEGMIVRAIDKGISVDGLERLLAMRDRIKAEQARSTFYDALGAFQSECPIIPKTKTVEFQGRQGGTTSYRYAPLEVIVKVVAPLLYRHGLTYRFDTRFEESPPAQVVTCIVNHADGHSESSEFRSPVDAGARMTVMQQSASALTYAKRYAFTNALGILTGDEDNDGRTSGAVPPQRAPQPAWRPSGEVSGAVEEGARTVNLPGGHLDDQLLRNLCLGLAISIEHREGDHRNPGRSHDEVRTVALKRLNDALESGAGISFAEAPRQTLEALRQRLQTRKEEMGSL